MELAKELYALFGCLLAAAILVKNHYGERWRSRQREWSDAAALLGGLPLVATTLFLCGRNIVNPLPWDYPVFYAVARAVITGQAFYKPDFYPDVLREAPTVAQIPDEIHRIVRFVYPPPTALLMAPLGVFDYRTSLIAQYIVQGAFLLASAMLLHRLAPVGKGWRGFTETIILMLAFLPVQHAFANAQLAFGALLGVAVALRTIDKDPAVAGIALAIGCLYKQLLLVVVPFAVCLRKLSAAVAFVGTIAAAGLASMLVLGVGVFSDFARYGQSYNPAQSYCGRNSSLFAMLCEFVGLPGQDLSMMDALLLPRFVVLAGVLLLITAVLSMRTSRTPASLYLKLSLVLSFSLLVFPFMGYYSIALILPVLFILYAYRDTLPVPAWMTIGFIAGQYALVVVPVVGGFAVVLSTWLVVATLLLFAGRW
jgi:hypothetical protein